MSEKFEGNHPESEYPEKESRRDNFDADAPEHKEPIYASQEKNLIHELMGVYPQMEDPVEFAKAIDGLVIDIDEPTILSIKGNFMGHEVYIWGIRMSNNYDVKIDGRKIVNREDAKHLAEYFNDLVKAKRR